MGPRLKFSKTEMAFWLVFIFLTVGAFIQFAILGRPKANQPAISLSQEQFKQESAKLIELFGSEGIDAAFDYTEQRLKKSTSFAKDCHPLMHMLGHAAFDEFGSFSAGQHERGEVCNSGYIHGLIEAGFVNQNNPEQAMVSTCNNEEKSVFRRWQCYHGLGHGAMYSSKRDTTESIRLCNLLDSSFAAPSCINGVYMELFIIVDHSGKQNDDRAKNLNYSVCDSQPEAGKIDCYFYAPTAFLAQYPNKYTEAADKCLEIDKKYWLSCEQGVGTQAMKDNITNPLISAEFCKTRARATNTCARGALGLFINHHANSSIAEPLCDEEFREFAEICRNTVQDKRVIYDI